MLRAESSLALPSGSDAMLFGMWINPILEQ